MLIKISTDPVRFKCEIITFPTVCDLCQGVSINSARLRLLQEKNIFVHIGEALHNLLKFENEYQYMNKTCGRHVVYDLGYVLFTCTNTTQ